MASGREDAPLIALRMALIPITQTCARAIVARARTSAQPRRRSLELRFLKEQASRLKLVPSALLGELLADVARQPEDEGSEVHHPPRGERVALGDDAVGAKSLECWNREIVHPWEVCDQKRSRACVASVHAARVCK